MESESNMICITSEVIATTFVLIPTYEMVNVSADEGTLEMENLPSTSVIEPIVVPLTRTDAPTTGSPSSEEVTTPFTDLT